MILPFFRYADFGGRSRRLEFWSFALMNFLVMAVLVGLAFSTGFSNRALIQRVEFGGNIGVAAIAFFAILGMYGLAIVVPSVAVSVRRLHDRGISGWWCLGFILLGLVPVLGWITSIGYLVIMSLPGNAGANRFGADPKGPAGSGIFA